MAREGFVPLCMTTAELSAWNRANEVTGRHRVGRPCDDCPLSFAVQMRATDRCNGEPLGDLDREKHTPRMARASLVRITP